jgi:hypothetical protein
MAITVASAQLLAGLVTAGTNSQALTVRAGYTVLVKALTYQAGDAAGGVLHLVLVSSTYLLQVPALIATVTSTTPVTISTWQVLAPGDRVYMFCQAGTFRFWLSGSILTGSAPPGANVGPVIIGDI